MMRRRSSARCSSRLMPGSSARSVIAARARSTRSTMSDGLAGGDGFNGLCWMGAVAVGAQIDVGRIAGGFRGRRNRGWRIVRDLRRGWRHRRRTWGWIGRIDGSRVGSAGADWRTRGRRQNLWSCFLRCRGIRWQCRFVGLRLSLLLCQLLAPLFILHVAQLVLNLKLELIAGAAKFRQQLPDGASDFRQLLGAKQNQSQQEDEDGVAEMHE